MLVRSVTAHAFGPLVDETLTFADGMTVVHGANESAKSSWHAAIYAALCGRRRGRTPSADERRFAELHRPWDRDDWVVSAEVLLDDGRRLEIRQDLAGRVDCDVRDLDLGRDCSAEFIKDGMPDLARWLGLDRHSFLATACVAQAQVLAILDRPGGLQEQLQRAAATAGADQTAAAALAHLEAFQREQVGSDRAPRRPLRVADAAVTHAKAVLIDAQAGHVAYQQRLLEVDQLRAAATAADRALRRYETVAAARTANRRADELTRQAGTLQRRVTEVDALAAEVGPQEPPPSVDDEDIARQVTAALSAWDSRPALPPEAASPDPASLDPASLDPVSPDPALVDSALVDSALVDSALFESALFESADLGVADVDSWAEETSLLVATRRNSGSAPSPAAEVLAAGNGTTGATGAALGNGTTVAMGNGATGNAATGNGATGNGATGNAATGNGATGNGATGHGATGNSAADLGFRTTASGSQESKIRWELESAAGEGNAVDGGDPASELSDQELWDLARDLELVAPPVDPTVNQRVEAARTQLAEVTQVRVRGRRLVLGAVVLGALAAMLFAAGLAWDAMTVGAVGAGALGVVAVLLGLLGLSRTRAGDSAAIHRQMDVALLDAAAALRAEQTVLAQRDAAQSRTRRLGLPATADSVRALARARAGSTMVAEREQQWQHQISRVSEQSQREVAEARRQARQQISETEAQAREQISYTEEQAQQRISENEQQLQREVLRSRQEAHRQILQSRQEAQRRVAQASEQVRQQIIETRQRAAELVTAAADACDIAVPDPDGAVVELLRWQQDRVHRLAAVEQLRRGWTRLRGLVGLGSTAGASEVAQAVANLRQAAVQARDGATRAAAEAKRLAADAGAPSPSSLAGGNGASYVKAGPADSDMQAYSDVPADRDMQADSDMQAYSDVPADRDMQAYSEMPADRDMQADSDVPADRDLQADGDVPADGDSSALQQLREHALAANARADLAEGARQAMERGLASIGEAEEELSRAEAELARLRDLEQTLESTRAFLTAAQERAHRTIAPVLVDTVGRWLPGATAGRYTGVIVDPEKLRVQVRGPAGRWRDANLLSHGTAEQVYLLLRVALAQHLARPGTVCPLLLDDVTVHADAQRTEQILELLLAAAADRQIIVFTQQDQVLDWARARLDPPHHATQTLPALTSV